MLIATQATSIEGTLKYFDTTLTQGDYYLGQEVAGQWIGRGVDLLGLQSEQKVTREQFQALLKGRHPQSNKKLTQRIRKDRRPAVDLTFSVPKSVSLAWAINKDERILEALQQIVQETLEKDIEPLVHRRMRTGAKAKTREQKPTGKLIAANFLHKTSRPVEGVVDPHLHVHSLVINWTEDEGRHYAAELAEIIRQRPSLQAKFEARLARHLEDELGYEVQATRFKQSGRWKSGWELKGIGRSTIEKFSQRTEQVESYALKHGVSDPSQKAKLGKKTREKKDKAANVLQLRDQWKARLSLEEAKALETLREPKPSLSTVDRKQRAEAAVRFALEHHLYRQSTIEKHYVVGTALEHALRATPEEIEAALAKADIIGRSLTVDGAKRELITTREVLNAERSMIAFVREGRGKRAPLGRDDYRFERDWLNEQQKDAVRHVLASSDTVLGIAGGAGTGKSSLMEEAASAISQYGKQVFAFAPSTGARDVLREKGFKQAETVEHLIRNMSLHPKLKGQVLWIDEAGLLDARSMLGIMKVAHEQNARVVLSGDTRQHASPRRGEAMRLLEAESGIRMARIEDIQRQKGEYRQAVELISKGNEIVDLQTGMTGLLAGFDMLDRLGKIREVPSDQRHEHLAQQYIDAIKEKKSALVVAPTHAEGKAVTHCIRAKLKDAGWLKDQSQSVIQLRSLNLSEAEKSNPRFLEDGQIVQFQQNVTGGYVKGDRYEVFSRRQDKPMLKPMEGNKSQLKPVPHEFADRFEVYEKSELELAVGDQVRFSLGGSGLDGKQRIANGRLDRIESFDPHGNLLLESGLQVSRDYGHLDHGFVTTSHASQGKDRHVAIAAMGSESLPAINARQFYVTASRGRNDVVIFVDDKEKVRRAIKRDGQQLTAVELMAKVRSERIQPKHLGLHQANRIQKQHRHWRSYLNGCRNALQIKKPRQPPRPALRARNSLQHPQLRRSL